MKKQFRKDKNIRSFFHKSELNHLILKTFSKSDIKQSSVKLKALAELSHSSNKNSIVKINNRCILTTRKSCITKYINLSRLSFLRLSDHGLITGAKIITW